MLGTWTDPPTDVRKRLKSDESVEETEAAPIKEQTDPAPAISYGGIMCGNKHVWNQDRKSRKCNDGLTQYTATSGYPSEKPR